MRFILKLGAGFIADVDNSDPVNHEFFKSNKHAALNGLALAILQSDGKKGKIILTANAERLEEATIFVEAK